MERARAWSKEKAKDKAEIARFNDEAREWAEAKAIVKEKTNAVQREELEAADNIISKAEAKRG